MKNIINFIKKNKTFFAIWTVWMFINLSLFATDYSYLNIYSNIGNSWDLPEVLISAVDPLLLLFIVKVLMNVRVERINNFKKRAKISKTVPFSTLRKRAV